MELQASKVNFNWSGLIGVIIFVAIAIAAHQWLIVWKVLLYALAAVVVIFCLLILRG